MVNARKKEDLELPVVSPVDKKSYNTCVGILRHLLKYRPDIPYAVHELSKPLSAPRDSGIQRLRRLA
eukprot:9455586-Pyramimonas_sp.AAC.1